MVIPLILAILIPLIIAAWYNYVRRQRAYKALVFHLKRWSTDSRFHPVRPVVSSEEYKRLYKNDWSPLMKAFYQMGEAARTAEERLQGYLAYFGPPRV